MTEFYKNSKSSSGHQWACKVCLNAYNRELHLRKSYGLTVADFEAMLTAQGGGCAACGIKSVRRTGHSFHVDHDHSTGAVRGLLCGSCNVALGQLGDSTVRIQQLLAYLIRASRKAKAA